MDRAGAGAGHDEREGCVAMESAVPDHLQTRRSFSAETCMNASQTYAAPDGSTFVVVSSQIMSDEDDMQTAVDVQASPVPASGGGSGIKKAGIELSSIDLAKAIVDPVGQLRPRRRLPADGRPIPVAVSNPPPPAGYQSQPKVTRPLADETGRRSGAAYAGQPVPEDAEQPEVHMRDKSFAWPGK